MVAEETYPYPAPRRSLQEILTQKAETVQAPPASVAGIGAEDPDSYPYPPLRPSLQEILERDAQDEFVPPASVAGIGASVVDAAMDATGIDDGAPAVDHTGTLRERGGHELAESTESPIMQNPARLHQEPGRRPSETYNYQFEGQAAPQADHGFEHD